MTSTKPAENGAGDGMGRAPSPTGQLRDAKQPPPTNSTEALEALFREAMRIGVDSSEFKWDAQQGARKREARRLAQSAEALASTLREENARLREGLEKAAKRFREYETSHRERAYWAGRAGKPSSQEALAKADRNREMAELCEALTAPYLSDDGKVCLKPSGSDQ